MYVDTISYTWIGYVADVTSKPITVRFYSLKRHVHKHYAATAGDLCFDRTYCTFRQPDVRTLPPVRDCLTTEMSR